MGKFSQAIEQKINRQKSAGITGLQGVGVGIAKGALSTIKGAGQLGESIGKAVLPKSLEPKGVYSEESLAKSKVGKILTSENLEAKTTAEKIGKGIEQVGEFFIPAGKAMKAEKYINVLTSGIKSKLLASTGRILGKSLVQGLASGGVSAIQSGGDIKEAGKTALGAGIVRGGLATIGEGARALRIPERLYSTLFKNTSDDMLQELRTESFAKIQKTNPEKFNDFVKRGLIVVDETGGISINPTIAKQALDSGLKGSIRNMTKTVIEGTLDSEAKVQDAVKSYTGTVNFTEPQFEKVLREISKEYENVGFNEISDGAKNLANLVKSSKGNVSAETALAIRRLLDRARLASSFDKPVSKLSLSQANLKSLADVARSRINSLPGMEEIMKNYSFYIDALDTLAKEAAKRGNTQAIGLIDSLFLSGAFGGSSPIPGATAGMLRRTLLSGPGTTRLAQTINKSTLSPVSSGLLGASSKNLVNLTQPQK